jgi:NAD(P)H-hydrate epimerase
MPSQIKVVTTDQMRTLEQAADARGLSYAQMMDNAGHAVACWLRKACPACRRVLVLAGPGNNGGDGLVAARYLQGLGLSARIYCWRRPADDPLLVSAQEAGSSVAWCDGDQDHRQLKEWSAEADCIVDALLGTGISRPIAGSLGQLLAVIREIRTRRCEKPNDPSFRPLQAVAELPTTRDPFVIAVDVPSGVNCDTGDVDPATLAADATVTFACPKVGLFCFPAAEYLGDLVVADIGIPVALSEDIPTETISSQLVSELLPPRPADAHKGTFGKALVVAGSPNYTGAVYLATAAAARAGAGLVTLGVSESLHPIIASQFSCATYLPLPHEHGHLSPSAARHVQGLPSSYDAHRQQGMCRACFPAMTRC